ncbi:HD domain-containing protein [Vibrio taketomensis]|uniref:HD domain-containing protein n=1 Tax=Vibrio taketomensis TaxID=2572923 RepID=UPI001389414B|nr:HD domain-containing protein [Vibrio taketomensis]
MLEQFEIQFRTFIEQQKQTDAAHDVAHILRVVKTAKHLCMQEQAQLDIVVPAAYLHDCVSLAKDHPQRAQSSMFAADKAIEWLASIHYPKHYFDAIHHAIAAHSFSAQIEARTLEAKIVQDADRLDALGAIGIARCLQVGTALGRELYYYQDPLCTLREPNDQRYTIDHFYTKLLTLSETMNTDAAKQEGQKRSAFLRTFLDQLGDEVL